MEVYKPVVTTFETNEKMYESATNLAINQILDTISENGLARIALSGGETPLPFYKKLFSNPVIEPELLELFQTDERFTPKNSDILNQSHILSCLGENAGYFKELNFINTTVSMEEAIHSYNEIIDNLDGVLFDLTILGIGEDGHFASLYKRGEYLNGDQAHVHYSKSPDKKAPDRITVSINDLLKSSMIIVLLVGENKRYVVPEILEGDKEAADFPAKFLLCHPNVLILQSLEGVD
jgi:6-phosphogluconolactonase